MKKFLIASLIAFASYLTGVALTCFGYANGSEEERKIWDHVFKMK